jgi:hypothetical protein
MRNELSVCPACGTEIAVTLADYLSSVPTDVLAETFDGVQPIRLSEEW